MTRRGAICAAEGQGRAVLPGRSGARGATCAPVAQERDGGVEPLRRAGAAALVPDDGPRAAVPGSRSPARAHPPGTKWMACQAPRRSPPRARPAWGTRTLSQKAGPFAARRLRGLLGARRQTLRVRPRAAGRPAAS